MFALGQPAQEVAQKLVAAFAEVFMLRSAHHGGDFRHRDAEFLLSEDSENVIRLQGKGNTQFFQHDIIIHPAFDRQRRRRRINQAKISELCQLPGASFTDCSQKFISLSESEKMLKSQGFKEVK